jgi:16S rRNA (cytosine967-C5)-methyltransferase
MKPKPVLSPNLKSAADARSLAVLILTELERRDPPRTLDALLAEVEGAEAVRHKPDRDLLNALVFGVLRWRGRLDYIISRFSKIPLAKIEAPVLNILRTALFQIIHLTRIPHSAAVNTAVNMAKAMAAPHVASFVNAVLRRAAGSHATVRFPDARAEPVRSRAASGSFPEWLIRRWLARYGEPAADALIEQLNTLPVLTLRTNFLRTTREALMDSLGPEAERVEASTVTPEGVLVRGLRQRLTELAAFRNGWFQVQDEAAQLVALMLDPRPGEAVLDACAGRGGKTGHLAQLMRDPGGLTAADRNAARLNQLRQELERLGIGRVSVREWDWEKPGGSPGLGRFDRILLDAPCSGLGTVRRNPDIKWAAGKNDLERHGRIQTRLLESAAACLKPGGRLVYSVCSPEPEETERVVESFLEKNRAFMVERDPEDFPPLIRPFVDERGYLQTYPRLRYMDGFFAIKFKADALNFIS